MLKSGLRWFAHQFGYDFVKTLNYDHGRKYKGRSKNPQFDYYTTPIGNFHLPKDCKGDVVANSIKSGKIFDPHIIDVAKRYVQPGGIILDIGANYGQMSIEFSRLFPSNTIYAFEAQEMVFTLLQKNLEENRCENVKAYFNAVYDQNEVELFFPVPDLKKFPCYGSYGIEPNAKAGKVVKSLTIDSLQFTSHINFMKVDVQGSDLAAMKGAVETIRAHQMPIIFEYEEQFQNEFGTSFQDYVEFVDGIGYSFIETVDNINYLITPKQTGRQSRPAHSG